jgi:glycerol-3-phosphate dehydrogenase
VETEDSDVAIVGGGVVGCAVALALVRRGVATALLEAESEPGLAASGTNSGILHTGFDSVPGELETELILRSAELRDPVLEALELPILRCGAEVRPRDESERKAVAEIAGNAARNGVEVSLADDCSLDVPREAITDPIAYTRALAGAAQRHGAELRTRRRVVGLSRANGGLQLGTESGETLRCRVVVNCAGLHADEVARLGGDASFEVYPRKGEFLVFDPPGGQPLERILLPVPTKRTKGVLVFPTIDAKVVAGPTAVDGEDKGDWSVRPQAAAEILPKAKAMLPALAEAEPIAAYAGLRPAGRGVNYLITASDMCPGLINVAAIRSTGLTASLGIAERVTRIVEALGVDLGPECPLEPAPVPQADEGPWWRRVAEHRGVA